MSMNNVVECHSPNFYRRETKVYSTILTEMFGGGGPGKDPFDDPFFHDVQDPFKGMHERINRQMKGMHDLMDSMFKGNGFMDPFGMMLPESSRLVSSPTLLSYSLDAPIIRVLFLLAPMEIYLLSTYISPPPHPTRVHLPYASFPYFLPFV